LANLFNTTKSGFLQRLLQSLGAFKQAIGEATFQRFRVRQQYPEVCGTFPCRGQLCLRIADKPQRSAQRGIGLEQTFLICFHSGLFEVAQGGFYDPHMQETTVLDWCKSSPIDTSTIARRCPRFPLGSMVAHCTEVSGVRPTYLRTRAKDVMAMFVVDAAGAGPPHAAHRDRSGKHRANSAQTVEDQGQAGRQILARPGLRFHAGRAPARNH
jgi:hypothetical protein